MLDVPKGKSRHLTLKAGNKKGQKMQGQNQISAVIKIVTDSVDFLFIQIKVMSTG